jgi:hypothetical protein
MSMVEFNGERLESLVRVDLDRVEQLHSFLIQSPENLEPGLKILKQGVATPFGSTLDLLGRDAEGRFVLIETKIGPDEQLLDRLIDHYDWFKTNQTLFCQFLEPENSTPALPPRGVLIGPGFDPATIRTIGYLKGLPVDLFEYRVYVRGHARYLSLEWLGSNWRKAEAEPAEAPARMVPLSDEELVEFEKFELERNAEEARRSKESVIPIDSKFRR